MILERIRSHNYLNGFVFSTVEFFIMALVISPFAFYYLTHGRYIMGLLSLGIFLNCLPIIYCGIQSILKKEKDWGIKQLFKKRNREDIRNRYPHMGLDTTILVIAILLPFVTFLLFLTDNIRRKSDY